MRKKDIKLSFRPSDKAKIYLERLGFLDGRTGRMRTDSVTTLSEFINKCIIDSVEFNTHGRRNVPDKKEMEAIYLRFLMSREQQELRKHEDRLMAVARKLKELMSNEKK